jgi:iron-sulfur cluster insertion protein
MNLTEIAKEKIKEISDSEGIGHYNVRVKVIGGGCAGFQFDLSFDDSINELDEFIEFDGIKLIYDQLSFQYLENTTIDFIEDNIHYGFKFNVPDAKGSCGCGSSFSF